ncbi:MAG: nucleotidyl transferase AbiEii/AbiGii toxin family protein [Nanoarchaeota archaeon]|nr:nucleotidyl transferase AbiEii/AbiGii toxin family protein [Nanoarchaeota archaeon]
MGMISQDELRVIASQNKFNIVLLEKDYLLTLLLYEIKDIEGLHFKGGTALNKIFLNHQRLSEDLDFSITIKAKDAEEKIREKLKGTFFKKITHDNKYTRFVRLVIEYKLFHESGTILIDLNQNSKLLRKPEKIKLLHLYNEFIPDFEISCLDIEEMVAEKIRATCQRYKPRDYYDLYFIIKQKLPISIPLVKKKFKEYSKDFEVSMIFKNTNKIFNEWNEDLSYLTKAKLEFGEMMKELKRYFKYKE